MLWVPLSAPPEGLARSAGFSIREFGKGDFVHGCFWHLHQGCSLARMPKSRLDFWKPKLEANRERDKKNLRQLGKLGWTSITIWECQLGDDKKLRDRIERFLYA